MEIDILEAQWRQCFKKEGGSTAQTIEMSEMRAGNSPMDLTVSVCGGMGGDGTPDMSFSEGLK